MVEKPLYSTTADHDDEIGSSFENLSLIVK
jgi:hypothetical protein